MDEQLTEIYEALAAGKGEDLDLSTHQRTLLYACIERANSESVDDRLGALRVGAHLDTADRMRLVEAMITDLDAGVRRYAFNLAIEAHADGLVSLKSAVDGPDEALAVEALGMLITQSNRTDGLNARKWLNADSARIRAGAAMLLGNISGPSLAVPLRRMSETDPDPSVRAAAAQGTRRAMGEEPKFEGQNFWEAGPTAIPVIAPEPAAPPAAPPPPAAPVYAAPKESTPAPPSDSGAQIVPQATGQEEVRDTPRDWRNPAPLPSQLPGEMRALVKLLGMVSTQDREQLRRPLEAGDKTARNTLLKSWRSGGDAALGRGIAIAIGLLELKTHAVGLRAFLRDSEAGVRAGAAEGVGAVGAPSLIPPLEALLRDSDVDVQLAAISGLTHLLTRSNRHGMLRDKIGPLCDVEDERIKEAAKAALASIS